MPQQRAGPFGPAFPFQDGVAVGLIRKFVYSSPPVPPSRAFCWRRLRLELPVFKLQ